MVTVESIEHSWHTTVCPHGCTRVSAGRCSQMQQGFSGCESVAILSFLSLLSELFELLDFEFPCAGATGIPIGR